MPMRVLLHAPEAQQRARAMRVFAFLPVPAAHFARLCRKDLFLFFPPLAPFSLFPRSRQMRRMCMTVAH